MKTRPLAELHREPAGSGGSYVRLESAIASAKGSTTPSGFRFNISRIFPILRWLPTYRVRENIVPDISGGLIVGCVLMAQSVAHAELSGVSLVHGPYSCVIPPLVYMIFGSSRHGSVGTGGLVALLTGEKLQRFDSEEFRTRAGSTLSLLVGLILIFMGALRLAGLVRFMSRPALSGFVTGSALLIIASQTPGAIGLERGKLTYLELIDQIASGVKRVSVPTMTLSACILAVLVGLQKAKQRWKQLAKISEFKELLVMACGTVFCALRGASLGIDVVGQLPVGLPSPAAPEWSKDIIVELLPSAFLLAVVVFVSSFAAAKQVGMKAGYQIDAMNELLGLGFANSVGALFGAVPTQIGLSRTSIAYASGANSQLGISGVTAAVIGLTLVVLTPLFYYMPRCALNCVIIAAARTLCDFEQVTKLYRFAVTWRDLKDLCVWLTAFLAVCIEGACSGMLIAMAVSLILLVLEVSEPNLAVLQPSTGGKWRSSGDLAGHPRGILVVRLDGALFYANAESFQEQVDNLELAMKVKGEPVHSIILDFSCIPFIDSTVVQVLQEMFAAWKGRGIRVRVASVHERLRKVFDKEFKERFDQHDFMVSVQDAFDELMRISQSEDLAHFT